MQEAGVTPASMFYFVTKRLRDPASWSATVASTVLDLATSPRSFNDRSAEVIKRCFGKKAEIVRGVNPGPFFYLLELWNVFGVNQ